MLSRTVPGVLALSLILFPAAFGTSVNAGVDGGTYELEFFAGAYMPGPEQIKDEPILGVRFGRNFSERLNVQLGFAFLDSTIETDIETEPAKADPVGTVRSTYDASIIDLNFAYQLTPESRFVPMLFAGVGWSSIRTNLEIPLEDDSAIYLTSLSNNSFVGNVGVSGKIYVSTNWYLRVSVLTRWFAERESDAWDLEADIGAGFTFGR